MRPKPRLLVVDDGERAIEVAHAFLRDYEYVTRCTLEGPCWQCPRRAGCVLTHAHDAAEAEHMLSSSSVDAVLLDVAFDLPAERLLPSSEPLATRQRFQGLAILERLRRQRRDLPVVVMSARSDLANRFEPIEDEFVELAGESSFDARSLGALIERVLARAHASVHEEAYDLGQGSALRHATRDARVLARTSLPILVLGETGTGKSALAERVIHPASRRAGAFVPVDLAALPGTLVASELFGSVRGAFSGALDRRGRFEEAHGGTLFLDEVGNLPMEAQRMLLLALESGRVTRLGESRPRNVDVKVVAATHVDLDAAVERGDFRADLYARLNPAAAIRLPPLRERKGDLRGLASSLVRRRFSSGPDRAVALEYMEACGLGGPLDVELAFGRVAPPRRGLTFALPSAALKHLEAHSYPGNVRELELVLTSALAIALGDALESLAQGRGAHGDSARVLPVSARVVLDLLGVSKALRPVGKTFHVEPQPTLHGVARSLEVELYRSLHRELGSFEAMARALLGEGGPENARKVRLRFNQLGLRVREP